MPGIAIGGRYAAPQVAGGVLIAACLVLFPLVASSYQLSTLIVSMVFLLPAIGLNLILGYTGMLSLAQMGFFGVGGYTSALIAMHFGTPFWLNFVAACLVPALLAAPLAIPALRLRHTSFVMCTIAFVFIIESVSKNWVGLTRGDMGLSSVPRPRIGLWSDGFIVHTTVQYYYLGLLLCALAVAALVAIVRSPAGRYMIAIREDEILAASVGGRTWHYRLAAFVLSAAFAGAGGSYYVHYVTVISPTVFDPSYTNTVLVVVLGGGVGTIAGPILGSVVFVALSEALRIAPELRMVVYGLVLTTSVFAFPKGLIAPLTSALRQAVQPKARGPHDR
ncbi:MAG: branched-chain amino acid ABC transporter permease [Rhodospirillales bacterium]|nr:branched-chain amino acid ABC transporter permease [Rhodospirillales bacterium]MDE2573817.1 branched-chain amino acid ABC transporter permease [Rhodospirillales bacterium]